MTQVASLLSRCRVGSGRGNRMGWNARIALLAAYCFSFFANASPTDATFFLENDTKRLSIWGKDRDYTNGAAFFVAQPWESAPSLLRSWAEGLSLDRARGAAEPFTAQWSVGLAQEMYTPEDISQPALIPADRPYAGWLYGSFGTHFRTRRSQQSFVLLAGVVGSGSLAAETQTFIHSILEVQRPKGWSHQLKNEPGIVLFYQQKIRLWEIFHRDTRFFDIFPHAGLAVGNVHTEAQAGARARLGWGLEDDFGPSTLSPVSVYAPFAYEAAAVRPPWELSTFFGVEGRLVARNIFLDGSTFADSHHVRRKPLVGQLETGVVARYKDFRFVWRAVNWTAEFFGAKRWITFGALQFSLRF